VETLLLGVYCLREPKAVRQLHAANVKALGDAFVYFESIDIVPAAVIRQVRSRAQRSRPFAESVQMAKAVDDANGDSAARDLYHRLYVPSSNFTVPVGPKAAAT
jgi:hypothetical protein